MSNSTDTPFSVSAFLVEGEFRESIKKSKPKFYVGKAFYTLNCQWLLLTNLVDLHIQVDF